MATKKDKLPSYGGTPAKKGAHSTPKAPKPAQTGRKSSRKR